MLSSIVTVHKTQHKHSHTCRATATTTQIERTLFKQNRSIFSVNYSLLANRSSHRLSLVERGVEDRIVCIGFLTLQSYYIYLQGKITLQLKVYMRLSDFILPKNYQSVETTHGIKEKLDWAIFSVKNHYFSHDCFKIMCKLSSQELRAIQKV